MSMSMVCDEMDAIVKKFLGKSLCKRRRPCSKTFEEL